MVYTKGHWGTQGLSLSPLGPSEGVCKYTDVEVRPRRFELVLPYYSYLLQCSRPTFCADLLFRITDMEKDLKLLASFLTSKPWTWDVCRLPLGVWNNGISDLVGPRSYGLELSTSGGRNSPQSTTSWGTPRCHGWLTRLHLCFHRLAQLWSSEVTTLLKRWWGGN